MTGIINGQYAVEQPQSGAIPSAFVGTGANSEEYILFFNDLEKESEDTSPTNSIDSVDRFGQYTCGAMIELGSRP